MMNNKSKKVTSNLLHKARRIRREVWRKIPVLRQAQDDGEHSRTITRESSRVFKSFFWFLVTGFWFLLAVNAFASVSRVEFYRDGTKIGEDTSAPYTFSADTTSTSNGSHTFSAKAYDAAGNVTTSSMNTVNVSNAPVNSAPFVKKFGGTSEDKGRAVATDSAGNTYAAGSFFGTATFDGTNILSAGSSDLFIAKYSPSGTLLWVKSYGGSGEEYFVTSLALDSNGNIYLGGYFKGTVNLGGSSSYTSAGLFDMFLAKYSSTGGHLWSRSFGGTLDDKINGIAVDSAGNVVTAGTFQGHVSVGDPVFWDSVSVGTDLFIAKYSPEGVYIKSKTFANASDDLAMGVALDGSDNIFLTGYFYGWVDFKGGDLLLVNNGTDYFLAKFNSSLNYLWAHNYGGSGGQLAYAVTVDPAGDAVVAGDFYKNLNAGGSNNTFTSYDSDAFLAKYSGDGTTVKWAKRIGGDLDQKPSDLSMDSQGNVSITGYYDSAGALLETTFLKSNGRFDFFVAQYSSSGVLTGTASFGGPNADYGNAIASDPTGRPVITGIFSGTANFGTQTLTSAGSAVDGFLIKLDPLTLPPPDTIAPTVSVTQPTSGATVSGLMNLSATASDNVAVKQVEFYLDNTTRIGIVSNSPYTTSYNTAGTTNGVHTITAKSLDWSGNVTTSSAVTVTVSN